ncbi:UNVERIFIED_CONTAM: hypothetical protein Sradi_3325900 [Sesamum radiatum]|uniref:Uncharacterized protein n=1 Tax=Sesamum radiatum TaxID=300843 RepID=A0AAW2R1Z2_SESRA
MAANGFQHQNELFYCSHWTRNIEKCFVDSLLEHHRNGSFYPNAITAMPCYAFDINSAFDSKLSYSYCQRRLTKLKIRYRIFL